MFPIQSACVLAMCPENKHLIDRHLIDFLFKLNTMLVLPGSVVSKQLSVEKVM